MSDYETAGQIAGLVEYVKETNRLLREILRALIPPEVD